MRYVSVFVGLALALVGVVAAGGGLQGPVAGIAELRQWMVAVAILIVLGALTQRLRGAAVGRWSGAVDPQRMYSPEQRRVIHERAGGQCEYTGWGWQRCRSASEHADHLHPHAKGGATSLRNGVAACAHHNTSKGAKVLARSKIRSLERRRRRYFPKGVDVRVGEMYDLATTRRDEGRVGAATAATPRRGPGVPAMASPPVRVPPATPVVVPGWDEVAEDPSDDTAPWGSAPSASQPGATRPGPSAGHRDTGGPAPGTRPPAPPLW
ncbi:hypothetical protein CHO01_00040 [Cellulomonas hominis]|uniref:5-methylcytosine-specific restriction endonuclease McrA n=1 Tax=Cellulomonas hominis TaxID=156981 RepID=A0A511FAR9_9CELL|nr:HNH endonuclease signature motif containing protein [Cellulomonas hominis]MBB5474863.1 5-methylcytosine-specific restriction endonuclease McrA [Cellulomonas hominis]NKY06167.1 HNH endonuclease [Cellulomonas hominis]GEL44888.1 hypothetical protein CHO01_00040 [Cellulomonas hominis]